MDAQELFREGRLQDAVDAALSSVRSQPNDAPSRSFLCELLCFAGELERADKQLDTLARLRPELAVSVSMSRQLIRAALWRKQVFEEGRLPEFFGKPTPMLEAHLKALAHLRAGDNKTATHVLSEAERERPPIPGLCNGLSFEDIRDLDDVIGSVLEILTANGLYYWIGFDQIVSAELDAVQRPGDLIWRPGRIVIRDGNEAYVHFPVLYPGSEKSPEDRVRLGRETTWTETADAPIRGLGQRMLLVGDLARPLLEIQRIEISASNPGVRGA